VNLKQSISIGTSIVLLTSSLYSNSWSSTQNEHGFILKSDDTTLYLGKSCDATSPQYGTGEWYWKDNEIIVSLSKKDISFNSGSLYEDGRCKKGSTQSSEESLPALPYHWIYDQNGCKHYNPEPTDNETLTWTGSCKNGYGDGYGKTVWYKNGIKGKSFNETKIKGKAEKKDDTNTDAALVGAAIGIAAIGWLFGVGRDTSSSSSSSSSNSYSSPTYDPCYSDDTCYDVIEKISNREYTIKCTKGSSTGETRNICANSNGKWATGCGATDIIAHHHFSLKEAANKWCSY
jgi:hypothetical protein